MSATAPFATPVAARPAATLVLLRPRVDGGPGLEVLLTKRPDSMRFGPGMYVFPGGRIEAGESAAEAAVRETAEETGIEVDVATLVPLTRWVTPYSLPARFDARFFGAIVAGGTDVVRSSDEVAAWSWLDPTSALEGMAAGRLAMWQPTVVTLQQLEAITTGEGLAAAFAEDASGGAGASTGEAVALDPSDRARPVWSFETTWSAGIDGRTGQTRVVGERSWVVLNPCDPTEVTIDQVLATAATAGASIAGVVIEDLEPSHHAGVELFARGFGLPVAGPPGANALLPYEILELAPGAAIPFGDVRLAVADARPPEASGEPPGRSPTSWATRAGAIRVQV